MSQQDKAALQAEAEERLHRLADRYRTHALFELCDAHSDGDDIGKHDVVTVAMGVA